MQLIIGAIVQAFFWMFKTRLGQLFTEAMIWMGLSFASYKVLVEPAIDQLEGYMQNAGTGQMGAVAVQYMGLMDFDICVSMVISAVLIKKGAGVAKRAFLVRRAA